MQSLVWRHAEAGGLVRANGIGPLLVGPQQEDILGAFGHPACPPIRSGWVGVPGFNGIPYCFQKPPVRALDAFDAPGRSRDNEVRARPPVGCGVTAPGGRTRSLPTRSLRWAAPDINVNRTLSKTWEEFMESDQGDTESMESLADVVAILRYEDRQDLAVLLTDAYVEFEYVDMAFSLTSDANVELVNATIYASISACKALRELSKEDEDVILDALREAWPASEVGGRYIQSVWYNINKDSLRDGLTNLFTNPVGWQRVDRTMDRIRELLTTTSTEEQFQEVGVLCREGLISVAQAVFDERQHPPLPDDNTDVSASDVKRMIARYVASECPGSSSREVRKCVNSAVDLANKVTHRRTSVYRDAALCAQAMFNVTGLIAIISGKRDRAARRPQDVEGETTEPPQGR